MPKTSWGYFWLKLYICDVSPMLKARRHKINFRALKSTMHGRERTVAGRRSVDSKRVGGVVSRGSQWSASNVAQTPYSIYYCHSPPDPMSNTSVLSGILQTKNTGSIACCMDSTDYRLQPCKVDMSFNTCLRELYTRYLLLMRNT